MFDRPEQEDVEPVALEQREDKIDEEVRHLKERAAARLDAIGLGEKPIFSAYEVGRVADTKVLPIPISTELRVLDRLFQRSEEFNFLPVTEGDEIVGYVQRDRFQARMGKNQFSRDIFLRPGNTVELILEPSIVTVEARMTLPEASAIIMARPVENLYDPFVVTYRGVYYGSCTVKSIMDGLNFYQRKDLEACSQAQKSILGAIDQRTDIKGAETATYNDELGNLGGDLLYCGPVNDNLSLYAIMDVCGKGLKASNMVTTIGSALEGVAEFALKGRTNVNYKNLKLGLIVEKLNQVICKMTPSDLYATGVFFLLDTQHKVLQYFDFGHTPVFIRRGSRVLRLPTNQLNTDMPFFGIDPDLRIVARNVQMQHGDMFLAYTDGLSEAKNAEKMEYGEDRIARIMGDFPDAGPGDVVDRIVRDLEDFRGTYRKLDDCSIMAVRMV